LTIPALFLCGVALFTGCAADKEHKYTTHDVPAALLADPWKPACNADLSSTVVRRPPRKIERGDTVEVVLASGLKSSEMTKITTTVGDDGTVALPLIGRVPIDGQPLESAGDAVVQACHETGVKRPPFVQVTLQQPRQNRITVLGAVDRPGSCTVPRDNCDLVTVLAAAGGLSREAGEKIVIRREPRPKPGTSRRRASMEGEIQQTAASDSPEGDDRQWPLRIHQELDLTMPADQLPLVELRDGDVVVVERRDPPSVLVTGMVRRPGRYLFPIGQDYRLLDALAEAGGIENKVVDTVVVCRHVPNEHKTALIQVSLHEATREPDNNIRMMPGDIVSVEPTPKALMKDVIKYVGIAMGTAIGIATNR
jgi:polysaccharide export outer membrane protein